MFTVTNYFGVVHRFETLEEVVRHIGYDVYSLRGKFEICRIMDKVQVRDDYGWVVPVEVLKTKHRNLPKPRMSPLGWRGRYRGYGYDPDTFRQGPVPGINCRRWSKWLRKPRTKAERTANLHLTYDDDAAECGVHPRRARMGYNLPTSWDDIHRDWGKNWKRYRKTQWK